MSSCSRAKICTDSFVQKNSMIHTSIIVKMKFLTIFHCIINVRWFYCDVSSLLMILYSLDHCDTLYIDVDIEMVIESRQREEKEEGVSS